MPHNSNTCPAFGGCADCRITKFEATSPDVVIDVPIVPRGEVRKGVVLGSGKLPTKPPAPAPKTRNAGVFSRGSDPDPRTIAWDAEDPTGRYHFVDPPAYNTGVDDGRPGVYPHADQAPAQPAFETAADTTLARARAIYNQRGSEYLDTWALENIVTTHLDHVLHMLGIFGLSLAERRLLEMGTLVDVKEARVKCGPWKLDNSDDGVNYRSAFSTWREEYKEANGI